MAVTSGISSVYFEGTGAKGADANQEDCGEDCKSSHGGARDEIDDDLLYPEGLQDGTDHGCPDDGGTRYGQLQIFLA
jgi:hypothetical protein